MSLPPLNLEEVTQSAEDPFAALNSMLSEYNAGHVGPAIICRCGSSHAILEARYKAAREARPIGPGAQSMC